MRRTLGFTIPNLNTHLGQRHQCTNHDWRSKPCYRPVWKRQSSQGARASIPVVVASGDSEVRARLNALVNSIIQRLGHSTAQRCASNGTFVPHLPGGSLLSSPQNTANDISHVSLPFEPKTLMVMRLAASATLRLHELMVPAQWAPWPLQSSSTRF